jgi:hypothetical protein
MTQNADRKKQLEAILNMPIKCEHRDITGRITYDFQCGILYENLQLLLTCICKGMDYTVSFENPVHRVTPDGILQKPMTFIVNGLEIVRDGISVSWIDH